MMEAVSCMVHVTSGQWSENACWQELGVEVWGGPGGGSAHVSVWSWVMGLGQGEIFISCVNANVYEFVFLGYNSAYYYNSTHCCIIYIFHIFL